MPTPFRVGMNKRHTRMATQNSVAMPPKPCSRNGTA
jgi:hypothetical protein